MSGYRAGFGLADITPKVGCPLAGYSNRSGGSTGVHDRLLSRALVLEDGGGRWAIVANDLCYLGASTIALVRQAVAERTGIAPAHQLIACTHTHSGPQDAPDNWTQPLGELVAEAVERACEALQPARLGGGFGTLPGWAINRRWLDRPVDPGLVVLRIDSLDGRPLGLVTNLGLHGVVLGPDNLLISADWPGRACALVEQALGQGSTCLFLQGGSGDANPLVAGVRARLESGHTVISIGDISHNYGPLDDPEAWNVGDRRGGTFEEVDALAGAFAAEALRVAGGITTAPPEEPLWSQQVTIDVARGPDEPAREVPPPSLMRERPPISDAQGRILAEVMLLGSGGIVLLCEPGEVFSQTAVTLKKDLRAMGYTTPMVVGYANGFLGYLPEPVAFGEGGYEVRWAEYLGISRHVQDRVWRAAEPIARRFAPSGARAGE